jgi:hypothetical protein
MNYEQGRGQQWPCLSIYSTRIRLLCEELNPIATSFSSVLTSGRKTQEKPDEKNLGKNFGI